MKRSSLLTLFTLMAATSFGLNAKSPAYKITLFNYPGQTNIVVTGLNDFAKIVGSYNATSYLGATSFVYDAKTDKFSDLLSPEIYTGINDFGAVVGQNTNLFPSYGFLQTPGSMLELLPPGASTSLAFAINNIGAVLGSYQTATNSNRQAFVYLGGFYQNVPAQFSQLVGINDLFQIVGQSAQTFGVGVLYENGVMTNISYPGSTGTFVTGINDLGDVLGYYEDSNFAPHIFVYRNKAFTVLNITLPDAVGFGINNCGQITGITANQYGQTQGFLATPTVPNTEGMTGDQLNACGFIQ